MLWFWIFVGPALVLAIISLWGERKRAEYVAARMADLQEPASRPLPAVSLIVPVSGPARGMSETLRALAAQDYPDFELILAVPTGDSLPPGVLPAMVKVALAGETGRVPLLQAGIRMARRRSEVFAFAAPSGVVSTFWLRALVAPLDEPGVMASTGFRWYAPEPPTFWSLMQSVWNAVIAGRLGPGDNDLIWRGAMAITRDTYVKARVGDCWDTARQGDLELAVALRDLGGMVAFAPGAMVACTSPATARQFLRQARREMALARRYLPRLWWPGLLSHIVYCGAMLAAVIAIARGNQGAEWALVVQFGLGMLKGVNRATLAKAELPWFKTWFDRYSWTHTFWVPLASWVWLYVMIASAFEKADSQRHCDTMAV